jgi:hypothetical protein
MTRDALGILRRETTRMWSVEGAEAPNRLGEHPEARRGSGGLLGRKRFREGFAAS